MNDLPGRPLGMDRSPGSSDPGDGLPPLELRDITKRFGAFQALSGVSLDVRAGEVHALLGENGAGKSTLMNIASGLLRPNAGSILVSGREVTLRNAHHAADHGIGMVHQQYRLASGLTVAENLHLGWERTPRILQERTMLQRSVELSEQFGMAVDPGQRVADLSAGERQRVAILRALSRGARVLILDEPTAVLTPLEVDELFETMRRLTSDGVGIVFITHKLREVLAFADRVSVLRGGHHVATLAAGDADAPDLARLMVGAQAAGIAYPARAVTDETVVLKLDGVDATDEHGLPALRGADLEVRAGEVLGIAGVSGNGQVELAEVIAGLRAPTGGAVFIAREDLTGAPPSAFIAAGVGHVPELMSTGLAMGGSIEVNAVMKVAERPPIRRGPLLRRSPIRAFAGRLLEAAALEGVDPRRQVGTLSGGQAQRLLVQREIQASDHVLVAVHPTRGLDVAATQRVHNALLGARSRGVGIVLISEDLDEVLALADRVAVLFHGRLGPAYGRDTLDRRQIGLEMGGMA